MISIQETINYKTYIIHNRIYEDEYIIWNEYIIMLVIQENQ